MSHLSASPGLYVELRLRALDLALDDPVSNSDSATY